MDAWLLRAILCFLVTVLLSPSVHPINFSPNRMRYYRDKVKSMFYHAYDSYLKYAFPLDELKPISCSGMDTWGGFSLSLIDSLDTLLIMGNETEFIRAASIVVNSTKVDANVNVSVFETNIRVVGGLLTAHFLSGRVTGMKKEAGWPCSGPLLRLAERFAQKLLPAFNTDTGMPYGTVNLRYGVHRYETPITCTAGVGTMILEFGTLSRITGEHFTMGFLGNPMYERVALKALDALWKSRSPLGLVGNHINVQTGAWTATDSGIGAGVDSYFEYLAKGALLFQRPNLMHQFNEYVKAINAHVRKDDWFMWVSMTKGQVSLPVFQSLEAFWPGILALTGNVDDAQRIIFQYSQIIRQYGFPPEFYNIPSQEAVSKRSGYPLRPEFVESLYYIYRATRDPALLHMAASVIEAIEHSCRTACGYATIENVNDHTIEDRMESFFLSETTKYLYLLFDPENFINNDGTTSRTVETPNGPCIVDAGGYIFNTEAHPLDPGAIYCCSAKRNNDIEILRRFEDSIDFSDLIDLSDPFAKKPKKSPMLQKKDLPTDALELLTDHREQRSGHIAKPQNEENAAQAKEGEVSYSSESQRDETDSLWRISPSAKPSSTLPVGNTEKEDETLKEKAASEKLKKLLLRARQFDEKMEFEGKGKSELAAALMKALKTMQDELVSVVGASNHLSSMGKFEKQKRLDEMFIPVAECRNCCRAVDAKFDSLTLKRMMSLIYANYIYPRTGIVSINGPVCAPGEEPSLEDEYSNQWPDVSEIGTRQALDPIDEIRFGSMRYRSLAREHYELLSSPPLSYLSQFTGLGQVTLRSLNETPLHI